MPTTAGFFIGNGPGARFVGGITSDGYIKEDPLTHGIPEKILCADNEARFSEEVALHLKESDPEYRVEPGPNQPWDKMAGFNMLYCFVDGHVWVTDGGQWFNPCLKGIELPKEIVKSPKLRITELSGQFQAVCAECYRVETVTLLELLKLPNKDPKISDIWAYFASKGLEKSESRGVLCTKCSSK